MFFLHKMFSETVFAGILVTVNHGGGGRMVSELAFYPDDLSQNTIVDIYKFTCKIVGREQKESEVDPVKKLGSSLKLHDWLE